MEIKKIKWSGRVIDITHIGEKTGTKFTCEEAEVSEFTSFEKRIEKILEVNLTTYEIYYSKGDILRVFNPIEVLFCMPKIKK